MLAEHVRQYGWIEPEPACDSACVIGRDQIDGSIIVILVFLVDAIDIKGGPAALSDENLVPEPKLLVQEIAELPSITAVNDLDHKKLSTLVCVEGAHDEFCRDIPWAGD
jgi:hypothetical protein